MNDRVTQTRKAINNFYRIDEKLAVEQLLNSFPISQNQEPAVKSRAATWIHTLRNQPSERTLLEDFMQRYSLSTAEGISLMSIAEAFLRVPDTDMADKLIIDKITNADWDSAAVQGEKLITTFSGWGLRLSESILKTDQGTFGKMVQRMGLPIIRQAVAQAIKLLGGQFVCGRTIEEAIKHADELKKTKDVFSFDMLGEGARTSHTADQYFKHYVHAIETVGKANQHKPLHAGDGVSVKLSALHPRYEEFQREKCFPILVQRVHALALIGKQYNVLVTLDAEEADRLEISLDIFQEVLKSSDLVGYDGLGLAVQAYQKRAVAVIEYLIELGRDTNKCIPIRLVKGAYWDSEIKRAQERGLSDYPVFTRKVSTDLSYLVCADKMLAASDAIYAAFATHNAFTLSAILKMAKIHQCDSYEFQRLYGMGQQLYDAAYATNTEMPLCRVYAPVGVHQDLLPYLVRRLLENGANSSFVHQVYDANTPIHVLTENPAAQIQSYHSIRNSQIPLPSGIYPGRLNSVAPDLSDNLDRKKLIAGIALYSTIPLFKTTPVNDIDAIYLKAQKAFIDWSSIQTSKRADILDAIAALYESHRDELVGICVHEGKKTIPDAIAEWREAIDFCRYYAQQARLHFTAPVDLPSPTGETNQLFVQGRGVFTCISPWNFPLAIFTGQVVAALVTGNSVIAKPAEQTPYIARRAVELMHKAGIPKDVLQMVTGEGSLVGAACVKHPLCAGIVFTGSTDTAWHIQKALADKKGPIVPFIAETGGQNAMIVDSTALPEQVVDDVIRSAFHSAGQRCSALRVLFLQQEISEPVITMLKGAMDELVVGNPALLSTDIGPVIDAEACAQLQNHIEELSDQVIANTGTPKHENFVSPTMFKIRSINDLDKENFGPLLHVITYHANEMDKVIQSINAIGYGLTLGIHSRIEGNVQKIIQKANVGNIYVNRSMIGAVVGVQPFGGMGLSGTGPKAGGPHYLYRFITEKTISINTTASGGNTTLATLSINE
jgi:RHH-type transcriptional regulator, proline utilization regulon repressor / proline dehydrogenase / delta 1-pyrroline-5-carboxylate dehydrogenase